MGLSSMPEEETVTWEEFPNVLSDLYGQKHPNFQVLADEIEAVLEPMRQNPSDELVGWF